MDKKISVERQNIKKFHDLLDEIRELIQVHSQARVLDGLEEKYEREDNPFKNRTITLLVRIANLANELADSLLEERLFK